MEYISAEEFLKQPKEVQKVFLDWWKCDNGDLYIDKRDYEQDKRFCDVLSCNITLEGDIEGDWEYFKTVSIPLITEGQLRKFIEDKTKGIIDISYSKIGGYSFHLYLYNKGYVELFRNKFLILEHDLLQSYWKVALEIAKEKVKS